MRHSTNIKPMICNSGLGYVTDCGDVHTNSSVVRGEPDVRQVFICICAVSARSCIEKVKRWSSIFSKAGNDGVKRNRNETKYCVRCKQNQRYKDKVMLLGFEMQFLRTFYEVFQHTQKEQQQT